MPAAQQEIPPLGKSFILEYDSNDHAFPVIALAKDPRTADGQTPPASGDAHQETQVYPSHIFVEIRTTKWDSRVLWIYRILPGPWLYIEKIDDDGAALHVKQRTNLSSAASASESLSGGSYTKTEFEPIPFRDFLNNDFLTTETVSTRSIPGPVRTGEQVGDWGKESVVKQRVSIGTATDTGFLVKSSEIVPISDLVGEKVTINYPATLATLFVLGSEIDPETGIVVLTRKWFVPAGTVGGIGATVPATQTATGYWIEVQPHDVFRSVAIGSKVDSTQIPGAQSWGVSMPFNLPGILVDVTIVPDSSIAYGFLPSGASNESSYSKSWDASIKFGISNAPENEFLGTNDRVFSLTAPTVTSLTSSGAVTKVWRPSVGTAVIHAGSQESRGYVNADGDVGYNVSVSKRGHIQTIPPVLTNGLQTVTVSASNGVALVEMNLPPSTPSSYASGDSFVAHVRTERWRFALYVTDKITLKIPAF